MQNKFLPLAFFLAAVAVALGAFGAHGLKPLLDEASLKTYQTGVQYHFYHAIGLAVAGLYSLHRPDKLVTIAGNLFVAGIIIFSGSLYTMTFFKAAGNDSLTWLGAITPLGGISFITGWILLMIVAAKSHR